MSEIFQGASSVEELHKIIESDPEIINEELVDFAADALFAAQEIARYGSTISPHLENITAEDLGMEGGVHYGAQFPLEKGSPQEREREERVLLAFQALIDRRLSEQ